MNSPRAFIGRPSRPPNDRCDRLKRHKSAQCLNLGLKSKPKPPDVAITSPDAGEPPAAQASGASSTSSSSDTFGFSFTTSAMRSLLTPVHDVEETISASAAISSATSAFIPYNSNTLPPVAPRNSYPYTLISLMRPPSSNTGEGAIGAAGGSAGGMTRSATQSFISAVRSVGDDSSLESSSDFSASLSRRLFHRGGGALRYLILTSSLDGTKVVDFRNTNISFPHHLRLFN